MNKYLIFLLPPIYALKNLHVFSMVGIIVPAEICTLITVTCWVLTESLQEVVPWVSFGSHGINSCWFTPSQCDLGCKITCCACQDVILKHILPSFHFLLQFTFCLTAIRQGAFWTPSLPNDRGHKLVQNVANLSRNYLHFLKVILFLRRSKDKQAGVFPQLLVIPTLRGGSFVALDAASSASA